MKTGEIIRNRRKELNMTQEELANKLGYKSKSTINKIELSINEIPKNRIEDFASVLGMSPTELMGWEQTIRNNADAIYDQYIDAINEGKTVGSMTVHEATLLDAYRESDEQTKEMAERILFYRKGIGGEEK